MYFSKAPTLKNTETFFFLGHLQDPQPSTDLWSAPGFSQCSLAMFFRSTPQVDAREDSKKRLALSGLRFAEKFSPYFFCRINRNSSA
jgi:hypothetical protein